MSEVWSCDARCHNAKGLKCECWCGGVFHGKAGEPAREAFCESFDSDVPSDFERFTEALTQTTLLSADLTETGHRFLAATFRAIAAKGAGARAGGNST